MSQSFNTKNEFSSQNPSSSPKRRNIITLPSFSGLKRLNIQKAKEFDAKFATPVVNSTNTSRTQSEDVDRVTGLYGTKVAKLLGSAEDSVATGKKRAVHFGFLQSIVHLEGRLKKETLSVDDANSSRSASSEGAVLTGFETSERSKEFLYSLYVVDMVNSLQNSINKFDLHKQEQIANLSLRDDSILILESWKVDTDDNSHRPPQFGSPKMTKKPTKKRHLTEMDLSECSVAIGQEDQSGINLNAEFLRFRRCPLFVPSFCEIGNHFLTQLVDMGASIPAIESVRTGGYDSLRVEALENLSEGVVLALPPPLVLISDIIQKIIGGDDGSVAYVREKIPLPPIPVANEKQDNFPSFDSSNASSPPITENLSTAWKTVRRASRRLDDMGFAPVNIKFGRRLTISMAEQSMVKAPIDQSLDSLGTVGEKEKPSGVERKRSSLLVLDTADKNLVSEFDLLGKILKDKRESRSNSNTSVEYVDDDDENVSGDESPPNVVQLPKAPESAAEKVESRIILQSTTTNIRGKSPVRLDGSQWIQKAKSAGGPVVVTEVPKGMVASAIAIFSRSKKS